VDRDGTQSGFRRYADAAISRAVTVPVIGPWRKSPHHFVEIFQEGAADARWQLRSFMMRRNPFER